MKNEEIFEIVKKTITDNYFLEDELVDLTESSDLREIGLDSLDQVEIIMKIEKELNIVIPDDRAAEIKKVGDLIKVIKELTDVG